MSRFVYTIEKEFRFEAAHVLVGLPPRHPCSNMHGHSYRVKVRASSFDLDEVGFVIDFNAISSIKESLDHKVLNEVMGGINPTAENLAKFIFDALSHILTKLNALGEVVLDEISVWETETCMATLKVTP